MIKQLGKLRVILRREDRWPLGGVLAAVVISALLEVVGIASILPFMQLVTDPGLIHESPRLAWVYETMGFDSDRQMLMAAGVTVLVLFAISIGFTTFSRYLIVRQLWLTAHRVNMRLLSRYMQINYAFFLTHSSSDLLKRVVNDVNNLMNGVLIAMSHLIAYSILSLVIFVLLLIVNPVLSSVAILALGIVFGLIHWLRTGYLHRLGKEQLAAASERLQMFTETIAGIKAIRAAGVSQTFLDRFEKSSRRFSVIHPKFKLVTILPVAVVQFFALGGVVGTILFFLASGRGIEQALPTIALFALAMLRLLPALSGAFTAAAQLNHHLPVIDDVCGDFAEILESDVVEENAGQSMTFESELRLEAVTFAYEEGARVLDELSLTIDSGSQVAFVGSTGSGKTTLVDVLIGLLVPDSGQLYVDNLPLTRSQMASWRQLLAYVPQDVFLFDETVTRNIAFGVPDAAIDLERVQEAARHAQIDQFIQQELPSGYETKVGERGIRLSGGQRQRLGLARAFYRQPQVLILDEATSALDGITEEAVIAAIRSELPNTTVIMIAHRLSTVRHCDRVFILEAGRVSDQGTFDGLFGTNAVFRRMVESTTRSGPADETASRREPTVSGE